MGLIDTKTMQEVRAALDKIDPSIIVLGEGWDMNSTMDKSEMTIQPNAYQVASDGTNNGIAFFNDSITTASRGSVFSDTDTGFRLRQGRSGKPHRPQRARLPVRRRRHHHLLERQCAGPLRGCRSGGELRRIHDNMTLYDKLRKSVPTDDEATEARAKLADSVVYLSEASGHPAGPGVSAHQRAATATAITPVTR